MTVHFRPYDPNDYSVIVSLIKALYQEDPQGEMMTDQKIILTLKELVEKPEKGSIILFSIKSQIVGYSILINHWSNEFGGDIVIIDEIYVKPSFRNQGIGSALLDYISSANDTKTKALALEVTTNNTSAIDYYKKRGFAFLENHQMIKKL